MTAAGENLPQLAALLRGARHCVAFTGAGVSTLSGIRDFRGRNGVYHERFHGLAVEEILSIDCFREHPEYFYEWAREFVYRVEDFSPNIVHRVLAALEAKGVVRSVYTQNIDLLHQKAGSRCVYELHGGPGTHHCLRCGALSGYDEVAPVVRRGEVPRCRTCGGVIKPDIVFYGECLDEALLDRAFGELGRADLLLVLGSSLVVQPAASMPLATVRQGGKLVIVNADPTALDDYAVLRFDDLGKVFSYLENTLC